ncbi:MAG TPA: response regulator [Burkholderiales bacterium]|nr:response regulator [Burkholderiales bacterium]
MPIKNILLVEDSPTDRHAIAEMLARGGYVVAAVASAEEAMARMEKIKPDLVLMDVVMPGQNGFQATRELTRNEATKHIPVIICTSKRQETDRVWGLRQGARDYIVKPIVEEDLIARIRALG